MIILIVVIRSVMYIPIITNSNNEIVIVMAIRILLIRVPCVTVLLIRFSLGGGCGAMVSGTTPVKIRAYKRKAKRACFMPFKHTGVNSLLASGMAIRPPVSST